MAQYMLSVHTPDAACDDDPVPQPPSAEEQQRSYGAIMALEEEMKAGGTWVYSGRLHDVHAATVVQHDGGEVLTTDGPFVESKEHLAGFYLIEAADLDEALSWATRVTTIVGAPIEVRPLWEGSGT
jgi:hypothetical protein